MKKKRDFYKTEEGLAMKKHNGEKASKENELIKLLKEFKVVKDRSYQRDNSKVDSKFSIKSWMIYWKV